jgi:ABC-type branched-subunit amino acid transport system substrate-binding protein
VPDLLRGAGRAAVGLYGSLAGRFDAALPAAGQRFLRRLRRAHPGEELPPLSAAYAAQATEVLLGAIARSDGTRSSVARALLATRVRRGILGSFAFDANGDTTDRAVTIVRITGRAPGDASLNTSGAAFDRVIVPPPVTSR